MVFFPFLINNVHIQNKINKLYIIFLTFNFMTLIKHEMKAHLQIIVNFGRLDEKMSA